MSYNIGTSSLDTFLVPANYFQQGGLWVWGNNGVGVLATSDTTNRSSPVQAVTGGTNWRQLTLSKAGYHAGGIKSDGTLWSWGDCTHGESGNNSTSALYSPVQTVTGGTNWKLLACGRYHKLAVKTDGTLWVWGLNDNGQLGDVTRLNKSSPIQTIASGSNWKQASGGYIHSAAIKTDGTLWLWGANIYGCLGNSSTSSVSSPVQTVAGGTTWKQVACGGYLTTAIKTDGTLWTWGDNRHGELGDNTTTAKSSPVQTIASGTNWKLVECASYNTAGIKTDNTLWSWGQNDYGQLMDNSSVNKSSPVQTVIGGNNWKLVSCGNYTTGAIKVDGSLWLAGYAYAGSLGDNSNSGYKSSPVQTVAGGTSWKTINVGKWNALGINGTWGTIT